MDENRLKSSIDTNTKLLGTSSLLTSSYSLLSTKSNLLTSTTLTLLSGKKKISSNDKDESMSDVKKLKLTNTTLVKSFVLSPSSLTHVTTNRLSSHLTTTSINKSIGILNTKKEVKCDVNVVREAFNRTKVIVENPQVELMDYQEVPQIEYSNIIDIIKQNSDNFINRSNDDNLKDFFPPDVQVKEEIDYSDLIKAKNLLVDVVGSSLLRQPNFKKQKDPVRLQIIELTNKIVPHDAEFILKLALYTRCELNIRTTANFLLCLASFKNECRLFLSKYFQKSVQLPSDWIDVAEQYQSFFDKRIKYGALPSALRKCLSEKFEDFDEYQLAKYNKTKKPILQDKMQGVKHTKAKKSDDPKQEKEEKYVLSVSKDQPGLGEWIYADIEILNDTQEPIKLDLIHREDNPLNRRNPKANTFVETIPLRLIVDFNLKKLFKKACSNQTWTKPDEIALKLKQQLQKRFKLLLNTHQNHIDIYLNDKLVTTHALNRFNGFQNSFKAINFIRVSGNNFRMHEFRMPIKKIRNEEDTDEETEEELVQKTFTLKQLIRQLHISKPVKPILSLLGKKYPLSFEEFIKTGLPGIFESDRAGKRMRLPVPETWETQISLKGNHAYVWEELIDHKKLPFMAMLRNLRNMIKAGISQKHHAWIIKKLESEDAIISSKQFPFRFFSAYEVLDDLLKEYEEHVANVDKPQEPKVFKRRNKTIKASNVKVPKVGEYYYDEKVINRYKKALDTSLKIATTYNISPIKGKSLIFVSCGRDSDENCKTARLGKSARTIGDIATLLGLMFKYSCEYSKLFFYANRCVECELLPGTILDNMKSINLLKSKSGLYGTDVNNMQSLLEDTIDHRIQYDNIIILSQDLTSNKQQIQFFDQFLKKYRTYVNSNLLFVNVDLGAKETKLLLENPYFTHENDVCISGYSDAILRFVAEKGNQGQMKHIENIDKSYDLVTNKKSSRFEKTKVIATLLPKLPLSLLPSKVPITRTVKVFISSTFRDMHAERDMLTRVVFPMLRAKLGSRFINVQEIDLRWGITEEEAHTNKTLGICLNQVRQADLFIGLLGERYGYVPSSYGEKLFNNELNWPLNRSYQGKSITQLEIEYSAFIKYSNRQDALERNFFFYRNPNFMNQIEDECLKSNFACEDESVYMKQQQVKSSLKSSSFEVYDSYECEWLGVDREGRLLVTKLDDFACRVYAQLLNAINRLYPVKDDAQVDEHSYKFDQHNAMYESYLNGFIGRKKILEKCNELIKAQMINYNHKSNKSHILLIEGEAGIGKTSFACKLFGEIQKFNDKEGYAYLKYMNGAYSSSVFEFEFLNYFSTQMNRHFSLGYDEDLFKDLNESRKLFSEILEKAAEKCDHRLFIFIDSIDCFHDTNGRIDESLSFMPDKIPSKVSIIVTARDTSSVSKVLKKIQDYSRDKKAEISYDRLTLTELELLEKSEFIRKRLELYDRRLEETGFNNQMKILTNKRDAKNPLYLSLVCEELRLHGHYETLAQKLKEYPSKISPLVNYVFARLEADFGNKVISTLFCVLLLGRDGLMENELKMMCNLALGLAEKSMNLNNFETLTDLRGRLSDINQNLGYLTDVKFISLIESLINTFIFKANHSNLLQLRSNPIIEGSIRTRYLKGVDALKSTHRLMALFNWLQVDPQLNYSWSSDYPRAYTYLPYHLTQADCLQDFFTILCDLKFIALKCNLSQASELMYDFNNADITKKKTSLKCSPEHFENFRKFFNSNQHILEKNPTLVYQQALNDLSLEFGHLLRTQSIGLLFENLIKINLNAARIQAPVVIKCDSVSCVSISPNGQLVACGLDNGEIDLYNIRTTQLIKQLQGHSGRINGLCFVSGGDSLCSTSSDGLASLWCVSVGNRIRVLNKHNDHVVSGCAVDPCDYKHFLTIGWDCSIRIWKSTDGDYLGDIKLHGRPVNCLSFHSNGNTFVTGCWDSCLRIFDLYNRTRKGILRGHASSIRSVCYHRNGTYIASSAIDGDVILWNALHGTQVGLIRQNTLTVNSLKYSPASDTLISGSSDRRVNIYSGNIGKLVHSISDNQKITCITFHPLKNDQIALGYQLGHLKIFNLITQSFTSTFQTHTNTVRRLKYSSKGDFLISTGDDYKAAITYLNTNTITYLKGTNQSIASALDVSVDDVIVVGSDDALIRVYNKKYESEMSIDLFDDMIQNSQTTHIEEHDQVLTKHTAPISALCFKPGQSTRLVSVSKDACLIVWNITNGQVLVALSSIHSDWITDVCWSNVADFIVTASNDQSLKVWDAQTGKQRSILHGHTSNINSCSFQYGCVVSAASDGTIKVWSQKGHEITTLNAHQLRVNSLDVKIQVQKSRAQFDEMSVSDGVENWADEVDNQEINDWSKDTRKLKKEIHCTKEFLIASSSDDNTFKVWSIMEPNQLATLACNNDRIESIDISKDNTLCVASKDKTLKIWNLKDYLTPKQPIVLSKLRNHSNEVTSISQVGDLILTSSRDGSIFVWKLLNESIKFLHELEAHRKSCNQILIINDSITFATCSQDFSCKIWEMSPQNTQINLKHTFTFDMKRSAISIQKYKENLIAIGTLNDKIFVEFYDLTSNFTKKTNASLVLSGYAAFISGVWLNNDILTMGLVDNNFLMINLDEKLFKSKMHSSVADEKLPNFIKRISIDNSNLWFTSFDGQSGYIGDCKGNFYTLESSNLNFKRHIHSSHITCILSFQLNDSSRVLTASHDGTVKIWTKNVSKQIGQYEYNAGITHVHLVECLSRSVTFLIATSMGSIEMLKWYDV